MKSVVVTGVSTGIGLAAVKALLGRGFRVFGSVRKQADADRLAKELGAGFVPLVFDVTDEAAVRAAAGFVRQQLSNETLAGLVNNAGIAVPAPLLHQSLADFRFQMEVNVIGQLNVIQSFAPLLGADRSLKGKPGRIINISSEAGKAGMPFVGAYAASKHAIEGMSESLRRELMLYGIEVIVIGPGAIATPIWDKAELVELAPYAHTDYIQAATGFKQYMIENGRRGLPPEQVGALVVTALTTPRPKLRYAILPGSPLRNFIQEHLPKRMLDKAIAKALGFIQ